MGYQIFDNGKALFSEQLMEVKSIDYDEPYLCNIWEKSKLHFEPKEIKQLKIIYKVKTNADGTSCSAIYKSNNTFKYNLFPATSFGDGIVGEFNLTIDKTDIALYSARNITYSGIQIQNNPNELIQKFQFKDFDLNKNKELLIEYNIAGYYIANYLEIGRAHV